MILAADMVLHKSSFDKDGGMVEFDIPDECDAVILLSNSGGGWKPFSFLLPDQVYARTLKKHFDEKGCELIAVIPVIARHATNVAYKNEYSYQRWCPTTYDKETTQ